MQVVRMQVGGSRALAWRVLGFVLLLLLLLHAVRMLLLGGKGGRGSLGLQDVSVMTRLA
jgi:hypothetical protein